MEYRLVALARNCAQWHGVAQCFSLIDGTPSTQIVLAAGLSEQIDAFTQAMVTSDNRIVILYQRSDSQVMHHVLIDSQANPVHDITPLQTGEVWSISAQNVQGNTVLTPGTNALLELVADGSRVYSVSADIPIGNIAVAPDGRAILMTHAWPPVLEGVDAGGQRKWQTTMPTGSWNSVRSVHFAGDDVYFAHQQRPHLWRR